MFFKINSKSISYIQDSETLKGLLYNQIKKRLFTYKFGTAELKLDRFIFNKYKINLKPFCLCLLTEIIIYFDFNQNLIIKIKSSLYNEIARVISYGVPGIPGSRILYYIFEG